MTLEQQLAEQAKRGLLGLGFEEETAEEYAPWASLLAQFLPGVGEGVGIDNTVNAINDERYGDAAIEGGLTLLGAVPVVGDMAAAAIKGIRRAPVKAFDEAAWLKDNPNPVPNKRQKDMSPEEKASYLKWYKRRQYLRNQEKVKAQSAEWAANNRERKLANDRARYSANKEELAAKKREYRAANPDKIKEANARHYKKHREKRLADRKRYYEENKAKVIEGNRRRESALANRTPDWSDPKKINEIYESAVQATKETGIPHEVDHVIPLQGRKVSGLHHQDNLLVVPRSENRSKFNAFEPGDLPPRAGVRKSRAYLKKIREAKEKAKR